MIIRGKPTRGPVVAGAIAGVLIGVLYDVIIGVVSKAGLPEVIVGAFAAAIVFGFFGGVGGGIVGMAIASRKQ